MRFFVNLMMQMVTFPYNFSFYLFNLGFQMSLLNPWSARYTGIVFGDNLYRHVALPFGLSQSPGRFQQLNSVACNVLNMHHFITLLYLDDRLQITNLPKLKMKPNHTLLSASLLVLLLIGYGGYIGKKYRKNATNPIQATTKVS